MITTHPNGSVTADCDRCGEALPYVQDLDFTNNCLNVDFKGKFLTFVLNDVVRDYTFCVSCGNRFDLWATENQLDVQPIQMEILAEDY